MAPRSSWKGFLKLSLVSVPVKAYTASSTGNEIRLNQLHKDSHQRIKYQKVAPGVGEVSNDEIVKGYEYAKGQYVVIDDDELDKLRTESDKSINIDGFIGTDELARNAATLRDMETGDQEEVALDALVERLLAGR